MDVCLAADRVVTLLPQESHLSQLSSVQLSPNRVREDFDFDTMDVFPMLPVSPRTDGYFPSVSPVSSPNTLFDSAVGSPVTSLSITDYAADLTLLLEPLIPLPDAMLL